MNAIAQSIQPESDELVFDRAPAGAPLRRIRDDSPISMRFNVMAGRSVEETFRVREYRIWHRYIEAEFDRTYVSEMSSSPSHVIFLTALAFTQKLTYLYMCHEFGMEYDPGADERFKFWPTKVNVRIPKMVTSERALVHRLHVTELRAVCENKYKMFLKSKIENVIYIEADVPILVL